MSTKRVEEGHIKGIKLAMRSPVLSHLFFADDSIFFVQAEERNCTRLKRLLEDYCLASGQLINYDKSSLLFSANTPEKVKTQIGAILGVREDVHLGKYLDIPMFWGRFKRVALAYIRERLFKKIEGWKQCILSLAGKEAEERNCTRLKRLLEDYCLASGQLINYDKSSLLFSANTPEKVKTQIGAILGVREDVHLGKYLDIPMFWGRFKRVALAYIRERVLKKIEGWKQCILSLAGKEVLIKVMATAVPTYPVMCFLFPKATCSDICSDLAKF
ncbi:PREDICTED: reverse mRNAase [Prunus dulcis]|uniref:PREDICTED: reverse mRNAase n=1 Tax=Prunus dulcis TaxID=3755 RepID=A0A5E4E0W8_PRUDU|nr:PREDICTED: reverse mRNAase [Prunus dulcis]